MKKECIISPKKYIYEILCYTETQLFREAAVIEALVPLYSWHWSSSCHHIMSLHLAKEQPGWASQLWAREGVAAGGQRHLNRNRSSIGKVANWQRNETNERRLSLYLQNMLQNTIFTIKRQQSRSNPKQSLKVITPIMIYNSPWCQLLLNSIVIQNRCDLLLIVILNIQERTVFKYHERVQSYRFTPSLNFRKWHHLLHHHSERAWKTT